MVEVYIVKINRQMDANFIHKAVPYLSVKRQDRIKKFRMEEDVRRSITSEVLIRSQAMKKLKLDNDELAFGENAYGKPYLKANPAFEYNVSHSGEWVVCAIDCEPVGIDVEQIKPIEFDIAKRFFTSEEYSSLMKRKSPEQLAYFYELWTLKESYIKAVGKGLSIPLDSFSFYREDELRTITVMEGAYPPYYLTTVPLEHNYMLSVCSARRGTFEPVVVQEEELFRSFLQL